MTVVQETIDQFPCEDATITIERDEATLLAPPVPGLLSPRTPDPLKAIHCGAAFVPTGFAPPRDVYRSSVMRVEWTTMDSFRQPIYHRNLDVDEMSYQVAGHRVLMTELGSVEHRPGDFWLIPVGTAHDNFGVEDIHLLFYLLAPVTEELAADRESLPLLPPYPEWQASRSNEVITNGLGAIGSEVAVTPVDEERLLRTAETTARRVRILHPAVEDGTRWLYRGDGARIGHERLAAASGTGYVRHRDCDEIQFQTEGSRAIVTQRGVLQVRPGDFVHIPAGIAFTSIHPAPSTHIRIVSEEPAVTSPAAASLPASTAEPVSPEHADLLRADLAAHRADR